MAFEEERIRELEQQAENFQEIFTNRHIIDKALNSERIMTIKILKGMQQLESRCS
ncbi:MAG: hypothetical protein ACFFFH_02185 [Candidatus Thorarchaeota archaeon]